MFHIYMHYNLANTVNASRCFQTMTDNINAYLLEVGWLVVLG